MRFLNFNKFAARTEIKFGQTHNNFRRELALTAKIPDWMSEVLTQANPRAS